MEKLEVGQKLYKLDGLSDSGEYGIMELKVVSVFDHMSNQYVMISNKTMYDIIIKPVTYDIFYSISKKEGLLNYADIIYHGPLTIHLARNLNAIENLNKHINSISQIGRIYSTIEQLQNYIKELLNERYLKNKEDLDKTEKTLSKL